MELVDKLLQFQLNFWTDYLEWYKPQKLLKKPRLNTSTKLTSPK